jgi:hypothetical protein
MATLVKLTSAPEGEDIFVNPLSVKVLRVGDDPTMTSIYFLADAEPAEVAGALGAIAGLISAGL